MDEISQFSDWDGYKSSAGMVNKSSQGLSPRMVMNSFVSKMCGGGSL